MTMESKLPNDVDVATTEPSAPISLTNNESSDLNERIKTEFMAYCSSFIQDDEEAHQCVQIVWRKYLQSVGDVAMLSAFFDTLPFHVKSSVLPKYQKEIMQWCDQLFRIHANALLCSTYYSESFQRVIRYALKNPRLQKNVLKKAIIYIPMDFDPNLIIDLTSSQANIKFERVRNDSLHEDIMDIGQLEEFIQRDANQIQSYPLMVIANAGTSLLGRCDDLTKIKSVCNQHDVWLHAIGDLLGSLASLSTVRDDVTMNCDSLTVDIMKLFGVQNLPYVTFFLRSMDLPSEASENDQQPSLTSHPLYEFILHSPSISFLSVWSIGQRCSADQILYHLKHSWDLSNLLLTRLKQIKALRILNDDADDSGMSNYKRICSGNTPDDPLPKSVVVFRFQCQDLLQVDHMDDWYAYVDLLNLWLFDKLSHDYAKMNLELLKSVHFQMIKSDENNVNAIPAHAIRFAPLEHLLDIINHQDVQSFVDDIQRYSDILVATMTARINLAAAVAKYDNLISVPMFNWAGIGAVRYVPTRIREAHPAEMNEEVSYELNSIQAELARKLQSNDSAFSLGSEANESDSMFYLRLGMVRKREDLDILLQKVVHMGQQTEISMKYVEDMAEKVRLGIEQVQKDLQDENLQLLAQDGLLRQLPLVSNLMSWWSPAPSSSPLATKGRSYDLTTGRVESTEETYTHRMQIKKQSSQVLTHNNEDSPPHADSAAEQRLHE